MISPRLRTADKVPPPYPLGQFPKNAVVKIAGEIVYLLHTRGEARLEGSDWEQIFAKGIGAEWKPSNIGLDDVRLENCCWGAKTVKASNPALQRRVRLISGRNSPTFSFPGASERDILSRPPQEIGEQILAIWNARVESVRAHFAHCRSVVLVKSNDLSVCVLYEKDTVRYPPENYTWGWNRQNNLEGRDGSRTHRFTWQPHGSQFTIIDDIPDSRLAFGVRLPPLISRDAVLASLGFDDSWVTVLPSLKSVSAKTPALDFLEFTDLS